MKRIKFSLIIVFFVGIVNFLNAQCPNGIFINAQGQSVITVKSANDPVNPFESVEGDPTFQCEHTLRWAINEANKRTNSLIIFDIPGSGEHIIQIRDALPPIFKTCVIDARMYNSNVNQGINVNLNLTSNNLIFSNSSNSGVLGVKFSQNNNHDYSLIIQNSPFFQFKNNVTNATVSIFMSDSCSILGNYFSCNENSAMPYGGYLNFAGSEKCKIGDGSSLGSNTFCFNTNGIALRIGSSNNISRNSNYIDISNNLFYKEGNQKAISTYDYHNSSKQKPIINPITTFANVTGTANPNDRVELFGSTGPENANVYLTTVYANANGQWSADLSSNTYSYVSATATDVNGNTSELAISNYCNNWTPPCPKVVFNIPTYECGDLNFSDELHVCNSYNWILNHIEWHIGNNVINTPDYNLYYQFQNAASSYNISANAFYTNPLGITCSTTAHTPISYHEYDINIPLTDEQLCEGNSTNTNLTIAVPDIDGSLSINNNGVPFVSDTPYDIVFQYSTSNLNMINAATSSTNPTYTVTVDGVVVQTGTYSTFPTSGSIILNHSFSVGSHIVEYDIDYTVRMCDLKYILNITVEPPPCENCVNFVPEVGKRYWVSGWVKENHATQKIKYEQSKIEIEFLNGTTVISTVSFLPSGDIIDEWQRIVGDFIIPSNTSDISINLVNINTNIDSFFDDIRVHPFNASMKSYVYDPVTFLLTAELDDNNYATFYEYDSENQLIGIKKETARGIVTIQEGRFNLQKP